MWPITPRTFALLHAGSTPACQDLSQKNPKTSPPPSDLAGCLIPSHPIPCSVWPLTPSAKGPGPGKAFQGRMRRQRREGRSLSPVRRPVERSREYLLPARAAWSGCSHVSLNYQLPTSFVDTPSSSWGCKVRSTGSIPCPCPRCPCELHPLEPPQCLQHPWPPPASPAPQ